MISVINIKKKKDNIFDLNTEKREKKKKSKVSDGDDFTQRWISRYKSHMQENKGGAGKINIGTIPPLEFSLIPETSTGTAPLVLENGITTLGLTPFSRVC